MAERDWIDEATADELRWQLRHERDFAARSECEVEAACRTADAALRRVEAACESDADLSALPALRGFIQTGAGEARAAIEPWLRPADAGLLRGSQPEGRDA